MKQTERATGLRRRTKEEIQKSGIKLKALIFQTGRRGGGGGEHQKYPASLRGSNNAGKHWFRFPVVQCCWTALGPNAIFDVKKKEAMCRVGYVHSDMLIDHITKMYSWSSRWQTLNNSGFRFVDRQQNTLHSGLLTKNRKHRWLPASKGFALLTGNLSKHTRG